MERKEEREVTLTGTTHACITHLNNITRALTSPSITVI